MLPYNSFGNLEPGMYNMMWEDFKSVFGSSEYRQNLIRGMEMAVNGLKAVGCKVIYIDGSFITKKIYPRDFDLCWDEDGVNYELSKTTYRGLFDFGFKMQNMKKRYGEDIVQMTNYANERGTSFLNYFQEDKQGREKGIVKISLI